MKLPSLNISLQRKVNIINAASTLAAALRVITLDPNIYNFLKTNDPAALAQAEGALDTYVQSLAARAARPSAALVGAGAGVGQGSGYSDRHPLLYSVWDKIAPGDVPLTDRGELFRALRDALDYIGVEKADA